MWRKTLALAAIFGFRHAQDAAKLAVDLLVGPPGERERQRRGDAVVALGDVAVVPDIDHAVGVGRARQRSDRPRLEQIESALFDGPFDVLRPPEVPSRASTHSHRLRGPTPENGPSRIEALWTADALRTPAVEATSTRLIVWGPQTSATSSTTLISGPNPLHLWQRGRVDLACKPVAQRVFCGHDSDAKRDCLNLGTGAVRSSSSGSWNRRRGDTSRVAALETRHRFPIWIAGLNCPLRQRRYRVSA